MADTTLTGKAVKKALMGATLIATSPAWGKPSSPCTGGEGNAVGCKDQPGVNYLTLDEMPGQNARLCADKEAAGTKSGTSIMPNNLNVAVDPFNDAYIEIVFTVGEIVANKQAHVLFLVYSPKLSPTPQIPTPESKQKLKLDTTAMETIGIYNIPALPLLPQMSTRIGAANPAPTSKVSFRVNLDTATLPVMMRKNENTIYLQAALLLEEKYNKQDFSGMILSETDKITFVQACGEEEDGQQSSYTEMDDDGTLTTVLQNEEGGDLTKSQETRVAIDIGVGVETGGSVSKTGGGKD
ncbi:MAG: hypothetical protein DRR19_31280 [Candidatus Parabeggiatoa sp. nov. 1]|nr:MAG: hypothetical protein DRR19_31280 [Gammaproteobacteria bacterium]